MLARALDIENIFLHIRRKHLKHKAHATRPRTRIHFQCIHNPGQAHVDMGQSSAEEGEAGDEGAHVEEEEEVERRPDDILQREGGSRGDEENLEPLFREIVEESDLQNLVQEGNEQFGGTNVSHDRVEHRARSPATVDFGGDEHEHELEK